MVIHESHNVSVRRKRYIFVMKHIIETVNLRLVIIFALGTQNLNINPFKPVIWIVKKIQSGLICII